MLDFSIKLNLQLFLRKSILFILAVTSTNGSRTPIGFTTLTSLTVYLPTGDPNADYTIQLSAEIRDIYGAIASWNISTVSVRMFISIYLV
jgi:hypothetical protein